MEDLSDIMIFGVAGALFLGVVFLVWMGVSG